ncbi:MAG: homoserine dehydrogenase [Chloroflexota bacterium]|nr:MAG: homoserine dehydrogenase [Chloroflexota bacterium]
MSHYKLSLLGFGNVGQALAVLLDKKRDELRREYDIEFSITGIGTGKHGAALNPQGIDIHRALKLARSGSSLNEMSVEAPPTDASDFIQRSQADILFENTPVNYTNGQPAADHLRQALELGMHAITANKGPVVHAYRQLNEIAAQKGRKFYFESTVMDGAPIFSLFRTALPGARLNSFQGILNSTTNLILTRMEDGENFDQAVAYAQGIGIAETDPSGDIDGWDAAVKVAALVTVLMDFPLTPHQVERTGIRQISLADIQQAHKKGKRWKLVCSAQSGGDRVEARVAPQLVAADSPLYQVAGTSSIVQFETDVLGSLSVIENDPGPHTTAYGLLADFLNAVR